MVDVEWDGKTLTLCPEDFAESGVKQGVKRANA